MGNYPFTAPTGGGSVTSVTATDTSIVVSGTTTIAPTIATNTLDVIAADHPPAANWSNGGHKITSLANGSGGQDAAAFGQTLAGGNGAPLTTAGDLLIENATPVPARLAVGTAGQMLGVSGGLPAWQQSQILQAATPVGGYALINGTGTIISWTAPSDGKLHRLLLYTMMDIVTPSTGGEIDVAFTMPDGVAVGPLRIYNGTQGAGFNFTLFYTFGYIIQAGSTFAVNQGSALTAGSATFWGEIWGS